MDRRPPRSTRTDTPFPYPAFFRSAGVGVLDDDDGGRSVAELADQLQRRIRIVEVVVGKLLALHLPGLGDAGRCRTHGQIERGFLMRVFAIADRKSTRLNSSH